MPKDEFLTQQGNQQRRLTKDESTLRNSAAEREQRQRYITSHWWQYTDNGIVEQLRQAHTRLMAWGNRNKDKPSCTEPQPTVSPWAPTPGQSEWINVDWMVNADTLLQPITPPPLSRITTITSMTPRPSPNTGEVMNNIAQDKQPNKPTTENQHTLTEREQRQQEIILTGQEKIRQFFHAQETKHMPRTMKMSLSENLLIGSLLEKGKFFPETSVLVKFDLSLEEGQIICE